jgi:hypothetical protein
VPARYCLPSEFRVFVLVIMLLPVILLRKNMSLCGIFRINSLGDGAATAISGCLVSSQFMRDNCTSSVFQHESIPDRKTSHVARIMSFCFSHFGVVSKNLCSQKCTGTAVPSALLLFVLGLWQQLRQVHRANAGSCELKLLNHSL